MQLLDFEPAAEDFLTCVLDGLGRAEKSLPCKFFYDAAGSRLFDRICELPEYYPTRTELAIMRAYGDEMAETIGEGCAIIEFGSGSSLKTRVLLDHVRSAGAYVPIDISRTHLLSAARRLAAAYRNIPILPVCADYTQEFDLPALHGLRPVIYFPGSTIGNFEPDGAVAFLDGVRRRCGEGSGLLIGVDLKKDPAILHAAYNDTAGVTARFNLNLLERINRELDGDINPERFVHYAFYNPQCGRVEMHLLSRVHQEFRVAGRSIGLAEGETIHTENSYKYTSDDFGRLADRAGYELVRTWTDARRLFSVSFLVSR